MIVKIWKQRTLQVSNFEPITFGYGIEEDSNTTHKLTRDLKEFDSLPLKEKMENMVDEWIDKETIKWQKYKSLTGSAVAPKKERDKVPF